MLTYRFKIFAHEGIRCFTLDGTMTVTRRTNILRDFRQAGLNDPRVLIISSVGATGLNLAFANILIQLVSPLEEERVLL